MKFETKKNFTSDRIKHLEMIQGVIARMANSSAWIKRLTIVVVGPIVTLAVYGNSNTKPLMGVAVILLIILWSMDAQYLQRERWFRILFDKVREESVDNRPNFCMAPSREIRRRSSFWKSAMSWSTLLYYGPMIFFAVLGIFVFACKD